MNVDLKKYPGLTNFNELKERIDFVQHDLIIFGKRVPQPRLVAWYGPREYTYSGLTLPARTMPPLLAWISVVLARNVGVLFDSVLCNLYRNGSDSVGWHADDESIFGPDPIVASLSYGATRRFVLRHNVTRDRKVIELEDSSLLIMWKGIQRDYQHSIPKTTRPVGPRINLTFRKTV